MTTATDAVGMPGGPQRGLVSSHHMRPVDRVPPGPTTETAWPMAAPRAYPSICRRRAHDTRWTWSLLLCAGMAASPAASRAGEVSSGPPTAAVLTLPSGPGSVRGLGSEADLDVANGQVRYRIDLEVPSGPGGLSPSLALDYDGGQGDGPVGPGWSLPLPSIRRSLRAGVPAYRDDDLLEAVQVGGASGDLVAVEGETYALEGQGRRVRVRRSAKGFVVEDGSGQTLRLGLSPLARREAGGRVAAWLVEDIEDAHGHHMRFVYRREGHDRLLSEVIWGPRDAFRVRLDYERRPDATSSLRAGFPLRNPKRLRAVTIESHGAVRRSYRLTYTEPPGLSRLAEVRLDSDDPTVSMPPVRLHYSRADKPSTFRLRDTHKWRIGPRETVLVDLDGDGIGDFLSLADGQWLRNRGGVFEGPRLTPSMPQTSLGRSRLVDLDQDGRPELLMRSDSLAYDVWRFDGQRWRDAGSWPGSEGLRLTELGAHFVDVNGDGYPDALFARHGRLHIALGGPQGFGARLEVADLPSREAALEGASQTARLVDLNGDGLIDVVGLGVDDYVVYLGRGDGTFREEGRFRYPWGGDLARPAQVHLVDLNRDGLADMVVTAGDEVSLYLGTDGTRFDPRPRRVVAPTGDDSGTIVFADLNGNGSVDVLWPSGWVADLAGPTSAGMLVKIDNGLGLTTDFTYQSAAEMAARDEGAGRRWQRQTAHNIPVCTRVRHTTAHDGQSRTTHLAVRDAIWDREGHRFGGFLEATSTVQGEGPADSLVSWTRYHEGLGERRVLRGRARQHVEHALDSEQKGRHVKEEVWRAMVPASLREIADPRVRIAVCDETTTRQEQGATAVAARTRFEYDDEGRLQTTHALGRDDLAGDESVHRRAYASSEHPWTRDVVVEERLEDADGQVVSHLRHRYDGGAEPLAWGEVTQGTLRQTSAFLADENRWITLRANDYDGHGNPVRLVSEGRTRHITYDQDGFHPVRETLDTGDGEGLTWQMDWDEVLGLPTRRTGPAGGTERVAYDALGRVKSLANGDAPPHTRYGYHLRAPESRILTLFCDGGGRHRQRSQIVDGAGRELAGAWQIERQKWLVDQRQRFDARGQVTRSWTPFFADEALAEAPAGTASHDYTHDAFGRPETHTRPNGTVRRWRHGPFAEMVEEPGLAHLARQSNGRGEHVRTVRAADGAGCTREESLAHYDAAGRLSALDLQGGLAVQRHRYDTLGRLVETDDPDAGRARFTWNDAGWLTAIHHAAGQRIDYAYDAAGRVTERSDGRVRVRYHYDEPRESWQEHTRGQIAWAEEPAGMVLFSYTAEGRLARIDRALDGVRASRSYVHSPTGLLLETHVAGGPSLRYEYDAAGRLASVGDLWRCEARGAAGGILREAYGNGLLQHYERDAFDQVAAVRVDGGNEILLDLDASRTPFGAVAAVRDRASAGTLDRSAEYRYDPFGRLVHAAVGGFSFDYAYDGLQNLVFRNYEGPHPLDILAGDYRYGDGRPRQGAPRRLRRAGGVDFHHDAGGRVVAAGDHELTWDGFNRLASIRRGGGSAAGDRTEYTHGYDGQRATARARGGVTRLFFDDLTESDGQWELRVVVEGRSVVRLRWGAGGEQEPTYLHPSVTPGVALVTDARGGVLDARLYEPFGADIVADYRHDPRGLADRRRDPDTGWVDHGARWLAPQVARWLSPDLPGQTPDSSAIASPWERNPYQALRQNPLLFHDPDGNLPQVVVGSAIGLVGGGALEVGRQLWTHGHIASSQAIYAAAAGGAVGGAVAGATCGLSLGATILSSAASSAAGGTTSRAVMGQEVSANSVLADAAVGAVGAGLLRGGSALVSNYYTSQGARLSDGLAIPSSLHEKIGRAGMTRIGQDLFSKNGYIYREFFSEGRRQHRTTHISLHWQPSKTKENHSVFLPQYSNFNQMEKLSGSRGPIPCVNGSRLTYGFEAGRVVGTEGEHRVKIVFESDGRSPVTIYPEK